MDKVKIYNYGLRQRASMRANVKKGINVKIDLKSRLLGDFKLPLPKVKVRKRENTDG